MPINQSPSVRGRFYHKTVGRSRRLYAYQGSNGGIPDSYWVKEILDNNIRVIGEEREEDEAHVNKLRKLVKEADKIYVLGFSFDDTNISLCGLDSLDATKRYEINITNYNDNKKVQKKIFRLFGGPHHSYYKVNVSTNSVYEAIKNEFD